MPATRRPSPCLSTSPAEITKAVQGERSLPVNLTTKPMKNLKTKPQGAIAQIVTFSPPEAVRLFPADSSKAVLFYPHEKIQLGHLIARQNQNSSELEEIFNYAFRTCQNIEEVCCFVAIEDYGTVKMVGDRMNLLGCFLWKNNLFCYYSIARYSYFQ